MLKLGFEPKKIFTYSKNSLLPLVVIGIFLVYFFSVSGFSEEKYHTVHTLFLVTAGIAFVSAIYYKIPCIAISTSYIYISYIIINGMRYTYGEDYMFSAGYNIWCLLLLPNMVLIYLLFKKNRPFRQWSWFYIFLFLETALIEKLQNQSIDADSYFFYKHIGMLNYPALYISVVCLFILLVRQVLKGKILNAVTLFSSIAVFFGVYFSDNLFAYSLFFFAASVLQMTSAYYYAYYIMYKDEVLDIANVKSFFKEARNYPLKYGIALMYIDEYDRLQKRFGSNKMIMLKKMFLSRIGKAYPKVLIYNYKKDALILVFKNLNTNESFEEAENIRRLLAKSIFIFNESNHLQLTVSQCVSEKKRSDTDAHEVLLRAEENLKKACKFTRNITVKA